MYYAEKTLENKHLQLPEPKSFPLDFHINGLNPGFLWNMLPIINSDSEEWKKETTKSET